MVCRKIMLCLKNLFLKILRNGFKDCHQIFSAFFFFANPQKLSNVKMKTPSFAEGVFILRGSAEPKFSTTHIHPGGIAVCNFSTISAIFPQFPQFLCNFRNFCNFCNFPQFLQFSAISAIFCNFCDSPLNPPQLRNPVC